MPTRIEDLLDLDSLLTPEDIELRQTVRRFGEQRPHIADWFEAGELAPLLPRPLQVVARPAASAPATGSMRHHAQAQQLLIAAALSPPNHP